MREVEEGEKDDVVCDLREGVRNDEYQSPVRNGLYSKGGEVRQRK